MNIGTSDDDITLHRRYRMFLGCPTCGVGIGEWCLKMPKPKNTFQVTITRPHKGRPKSAVVCGMKKYGKYGFAGMTCVIAVGHTGYHKDNLGKIWE